MSEHVVSHHPTHMTSTQGCWATCSCGWRSATYRGVVGAHLDFGQHLIATHDPHAAPAVVGDTAAAAAMKESDRG